MTRIGMPGHTHEGGTVTRYRHVVSLASHSNLTTKSSDAGALFRVPNYSSSINAGTPPEHSDNTTISSHADTSFRVTEYSNSVVKTTNASVGTNPVNSPVTGPADANAIHFTTRGTLTDTVDPNRAPDTSNSCAS